MVLMDFPIKVYKLMRYGWTLEKDPATGSYIYGSIPRSVLDNTELCKSYLKKCRVSMMKTVSNIQKSFRSLCNRYPRIAMSCTVAAATVVYFIGVGIAWSIAIKVLRLLRLF